MRKLRERQVENQLHYIHRLLRAAVVLKAPKVDVLCKHGKTRVAFPAPVCRPDQLDSLLESILEREQPALRELSTAANLALGLNPVLIEVKVSDGQSCRVLSIKHGDGQVYQASACEPGTTFQLERKIGLGLAAIGTEPPEYFNLFKRFRYCPIALSINGKAVKEGRGWGEKSGAKVSLGGFFSFFRSSFHASQHAIEMRVKAAQPELNGLRLGPSQADSAILISSETNPVRRQSWLNDPRGDYALAIGLSMDKTRPSTASFILWGETLQVFPVKLAIPGVEILISAQGLDLDLSGERLIENSSFEELWNDTKAHYQMLETALATAYPRARGHNLVVRALRDKRQAWRNHIIARS